MELKFKDMSRNMYYKKILIFSKEDLPKEEGMYKGVVDHLILDVLPSVRIENIVDMFYCDSPEIVNFWLKYVRYYFEPCETDFEEIIKLQKELIEILKEGGLTYNPEITKELEEKIKILLNAK